MSEGESAYDIRMIHRVICNIFTYTFAVNEDELFLASLDSLDAFVPLCSHVYALNALSYHPLESIL